MESNEDVSCCMCGDRGLSQELFRCKVCLTRSQHKYCSNLYPKLVSYGACNWCLKEEEEARNNSTTKEAASCSISVNRSASTSNSSSMNRSSSSGNLIVKLNRGVLFTTHLNKAVKKHKAETLESSSSPRKVKLGRGKQVINRGKAKRYKLLEEFSS